MSNANLRPIGTVFTVVYSPDLANTGDAGDHPHEVTYQIAHAQILVGEKEETAEQWIVLGRRCLNEQR